MDSNPHKPCDACTTDADSGYPFCVDCGKPAPFALKAGAFSVEIQDVPSEELRSQLASSLKKWFPDINRIDASDILSSGKSILLSGVDEDSAERLIGALKKFKVNGRIIDIPRNRWSLLWNPGLIFSLPALLAAWVFNGAASLIFFLCAPAIPVVVAFRKHYRSRPVIALEFLNYLSDEEFESARQYREIIGSLGREDSARLKSIVRRAFDLHNKLKSKSLSAAAAGSRKGELYGRLTDAVDMAVQICTDIGTADIGLQDDLRNSLASLDVLLKDTEAWFLNLESDDRKSVPGLAEELTEITAGIDGIVNEIRETSDRHAISAARTRISE